MPAKCEGPGPAYMDETQKPAIKWITEEEKSLNKQMSKSRMENFIPRFEITGKIAYKEYKKDL